MWNERERDRRARERGMCGHLCASECEAHKYVRGCNIAGGWFACGDEEVFGQVRAAVEYVCGCARGVIIECARGVTVVPKSARV